MRSGADSHSFSDTDLLSPLAPNAKYASSTVHPMFLNLRPPLAAPVNLAPTLSKPPPHADRNPSEPSPAPTTAAPAALCSSSPSPRTNRSPTAAAGSPTSANGARRTCSSSSSGTRGMCSPPPQRKEGEVGRGEKWRGKRRNGGLRRKGWRAMSRRAPRAARESKRCVGGFSPPHYASIFGVNSRFRSKQKRFLEADPTAIPPSSHSNNSLSYNLPPNGCRLTPLPFDNNRPSIP